MTEFDIVVHGGTVVDGTGSPVRRADVGVSGDRIRAVGDLAGASAGAWVSAEDRVVCPGFIDMHTHSDLTALLEPACSSKARQGVTTELVGHCGFSAFPLVHGTNQERTLLDGAILTGEGIEAGWTSCAGYLEAIARARPAINVATLVGNGTVRSAVIGFDQRPATPAELRKMRREVARAMEEGAFGLSTGLTLYPSSVAETDEVVALCEEVARYGGLYDTHVRHLPGWYFKSSEEAIHIGRRTGVPVQIAHLFLPAPLHAGQGARLLEIIETAREAGDDVTFDAYPYLAAGCPMGELMPDWLQDGGTQAMLDRAADPSLRQKAIAETAGVGGRRLPRDWTRVVVASSGPRGDPAWNGQIVKSLADAAGVSPEEMALEILVQSADQAQLIVFNRAEEDVEQFISHPMGMIGSDGKAISADGRWSNALVHPRFYGTFPRVLARYVRERRSLSLEEAIRKMTSLPARRLQLDRRGQVREGYVADLVILDPAAVQDQATFERPHQYPLGISHVMVGGQWVIVDGEQTPARPGAVLRRGA
ncbi:MAG TPA: D-aminoacylase [Anaerolineae bacterium]|nr:D-aminoacylase [Anaerolineae bacterium]